MIPLLAPMRVENLAPSCTVGSRILTVEDDERIRTSVRLALEDEGYDVAEAESGEDALLAFGRQGGAGPPSPRPSSPPPPPLKDPPRDPGVDYLVQFAPAGDDREPALLAACRAGAYACVEQLTRDAG